MSDPVGVAQLGVAGVCVSMLLVACITLWKTLQAERAARDADQRAMLPALTQATAAVSAATSAIDRITHRLDEPRGDRR